METCDLILTKFHFQMNYENQFEFKFLLLTLIILITLWIIIIFKYCKYTKLEISKIISIPRNEIDNTY